MISAILYRARIVRPTVVPPTYYTYYKPDPRLTHSAGSPKLATFSGCPEGCQIQGTDQNPNQNATATHTPPFPLSECLHISRYASDPWIRNCFAPSPKLLIS